MASTKERVSSLTRFVAVVIDCIVVGVVATMLGRERAGLLSLTGALYSVLLWVNWNGQTLGKKVMKIKVVTESGKAVGYKEAVVRFLGYILSGAVLGLGFLWIIWDKKKQGWHDKIAGTLVVKE